MDRDARLRKAVQWLGKKDPVLKKLIQKVGPCTLKPIGSPYHVLVKSVVGQQLSTKAAASMQKKLIDRFGSRNKFPTPENLVNLSHEELRSAGMSNAKAQTLHRIGIAYSEKTITDSKLRKLDDENVIEELCKIKGIGPWTAEMVLMFALDRWDHFSLNDLVLRKAVEIHYGIDRNSKKEIINHANLYSPYKTIFSWYLWASISNGDEEW
ncbi:DNA-3-methyladenine glycosylase [Leptospira perolatii]|uniref:DNA-3-methyladenine glycosylase II n=1 Tax=Leptospira perolatii TaxID=2023191 RepID=A0A2M9ZSB9_9LEPT|nr:DNA-3-methyladenine glycosylase [Leptospira perolatii]PJZ71335.1 DNA-3-methyladenine glycosylase [Leptospira perolatii]PJZ74869.1 DNA-3-methyladenine glycosylase [Leptospira perolatii]